MINLNENYITWICCECGDKYGNHKAGVCTWHPGICDVCNKMRSVTELRDFGGIDANKKPPKTNTPS